jgi:chemotaxis protein histidine kinase CheA
MPVQSCACMDTVVRCVCCLQMGHTAVDKKAIQEIPDIFLFDDGKQTVVIDQINCTFVNARTRQVLTGYSWDYIANTVIIKNPTNTVIGTVDCNGKYTATKQAFDSDEAIRQAAREEADREQAARVKAAQEQAARDRAAREQADREQAARAKAAQEQAARDKAAREEADREQAARAKAAQEQAARDKAAREEADREQAARAKAAQEQAARDRAAREQADREQAARDRAAREQADREQAARDRAARDQEACDETTRQSAPYAAHPLWTQTVSVPFKPGWLSCYSFFAVCVCVFFFVCVCVLVLQGPTYTDVTDGEKNEILRLQLEILSYKQGRAELVLKGLLQKQQQLAKQQQDRH